MDAASRDLSTALAAQHSRIKAMMTDVLNSDGAVRADSFAELCHYLAIHEAAEEEVMHPAALAGADQSGVVRVIEDRLEEEKGAGDVIGQLEGIDSVDAPGFLVQFDLLHAAVQTHAEAEEEREVPILVAAGDAVAIGRVLDALARVDGLAEDEAGPVARGGRFAVMHERARELFATAAPPR